MCYRIPYFDESRRLSRRALSWHRIERVAVSTKSTIIRRKASDGAILSFRHFCQNLFFRSFVILISTRCRSMHLVSAFVRTKSNKKICLKHFLFIADKPYMPIIIIDDKIAICLGNNSESTACGKSCGDTCDGCEEFFDYLRALNNSSCANLES